MYGVEWNRGLQKFASDMSIYLYSTFVRYVHVCMSAFFASFCSVFPEIFVCVCAITNENAIEHVETWFFLLKRIYVEFKFLYGKKAL